MSQYHKTYQSHKYYNPPHPKKFDTTQPSQSGEAAI